MMVFPEGLALKACCPERAPTLHVAVVSAIAAHLPWTLNNAVAPAGFWLRGLPQQKIGSVIRSLVAEPTEADPDYSPPPLDKRIARLAQAVPPFNIFVCAPSTLASFKTPDVSDMHGNPGLDLAGLRMRAAMECPTCVTLLLACRCCHGSRDARCGVIGARLVRALQELVQARGWQDSIAVFRCSHIGGHKASRGPRS